MNRLQALTEEFKFKYERFLIGCDALEEMDLWDKETYGEMDVFYENDMLSVILRLITADGSISQREVKYLNENFGLDYTAEKLRAVYENCRDAIGRPFDETFRTGVDAMRAINEKIADAYRELLVIICDIISESDGIVAPAEIDVARKMKELF